MANVSLKIAEMTPPRNDSRGGFYNDIFMCGIERRSKERYNVVIIAEAINRNPFLQETFQIKLITYRG